jgi:amino acid adenylation domain-containing protein
MTNNQFQRIAGKFALLTAAQQRTAYEKMRASGVDIRQLPVPARAPCFAGSAPLSPAQLGQWLLWRMDPASSAYHISTALEIEGALDENCLRESLAALVAGHESLRTVFVADEAGLPLQQIMSAGGLDFLQEDISHLPPAGQQEELAGHTARLSRKSFDLGTGPLLRVGLLRLAEQRHVLVLVMHHIVSDGWSLQLVMEAFAAQYRARIAGRPARQEAPPIQYADHALWQKSWLEAGEAERQLAYWKARLGEEPAVLQLHADHARQAQGSYTVACHSAMLPPELVRGLRVRAQSDHATVFMLLLAAFQALLYRHTGQAEIRIGVPMASRSRATEGLIGLFVNTLVLGARVDGRSSLRTLVAQARDTTLGAQEHQDLPFEQLVQALRPQRSQGQAPLFQVMFSHMHQDDAALHGLPGLRVRQHRLEGQYAQFELALDIVESAQGGIEARFSYARELFQPDSVERWAAHYAALLQALVEQPEAALGDIGLLDAREAADLRAWGRNPPVAVESLLVHELIARHAAATPDAPAVISQEAALSHGELDRRASRVARLLASQGVGPESRVGLALHPSAEMVAGLLAIMKTGAAFVPLDLRYPAQRLAHMVRDSGIDCLLTQLPLDPAFAGSPGLTVLTLDTPLPEGSDASRPLPAVHGDSLAYVIYTSGSTGQPKGVAVSHGALAMHIQAMGRICGIRPSHRACLFASVSFDAACEQWMVPLAGGASVLVSDPRGWTAREFLARVRDARVSTLDLPLAFIRMLAHEGLDKPGGGLLPLEHCIIGGEALPAAGLELARRVFPGARIFNAYGPTEAVVTPTIAELGAAAGDIGAGGHACIGRPVGARSAWVLDADMQLVAPGVAGELYLGGQGLARAYLGQPGLSAERFVANPHGEPGSRLYRSGDLVRWRADGRLDYLGRIDQQIKIRGYRVEPVEVEAVLLAQPGVREAAVLTGPGPGGPRLIAYVSAGAQQALDVDGLRARLALSLPDYMVPGALVVLDSLPMTVNGKLDRQALPDPEQTPARGYEAAQGPHEELLAGIWVALLKLDRVGRHDNFFELGGHSLLAIQLLDRLRGAGWQADVRALFLRPRLLDFAGTLRPFASDDAAALAGSGGIPPGCPAIEPAMVPLSGLGPEELRIVESAIPGGAANIQDIYPLAPLQEGILFHHLMHRAGDSYVTHNLLGFDSLDRLSGFIDGLNQVIARHDILRTAVLWEGLAAPVQVVCRQAALSLKVVEDDDGRGGAAERLAALVDPASFRIDVRRAPMVRALAAFDAPRQRWLLQLPSHHLVMDHTTLELLVGEIALIQQDRRGALPEPVPFRRYVAHARLGVGQAEHQAFFSALLGDLTEPTAPFGLLDVQGDGADVAEARLRLEDTLAARVRQQARRSGVSAAAVFHLAWAMVLARATGRDDVVFGTVLFGRMQGGQGAERAVGLFINTLPLRVRLGARGVARCLRDTHGLLAQLLHHEHASLSLAQRCSGLPGGLPLFSSLLNYRYGGPGAADRAAAWHGMELLESRERSNYPFGMSVDEQGHAFTLVAQVARPADAAQACADLREALRGLVEALVQAPERPVCEIALDPESEDRQLLAWGDKSGGRMHAMTVQALFEQQVRQRPGAQALAGDAGSWTYEQLNRQANRLAHRLMALGVGPESRVGIALERGAGMVAALLAVLKAGGAYVPLDADNPRERLAWMLADSAAGLVLTHGAWLERIPAMPGTRLLALESLETADQPAHDPAAALHGENLAYVMYTSGSTGRPKGTEIAHRSITRLVLEADYARLDARLRMLQFAPLAFDASTFEIWGTLCNGGTLVQAPAGRVPFDELASLMERHGVNCAWLTAALFNQMLESHPGALAALSQLLSGGEAMSVHHARLALERLASTALVNGYGPTECTTFAVCCRVGPDDAAGAGVPLGRPINQTSVHVLDATMSPVAPGVAGELFLGGAGLARGYLRRAGLTAERFVANSRAGDGSRLYRTGDLVRWNRAGQLEYLGRIDHQLKVRGYRIEAGEIEAGLMAQPEVREAVVVARASTGGARLLAYVSLHAVWPAAAGGLRERLAGLLPDYMVPNAVVVLQALPLNSNGKVDRQALPEPAMAGGRDCDPPRGALEERLADIWAEVLGVDRPSRGDNFFELGGHSMAVLEVQMLVRKRMSADLPLRACFESPTLAAMALLVQTHATTDGARKSADLQTMASLLEELDLE